MQRCALHYHQVQQWQPNIAGQNGLLGYKLPAMIENYRPKFKWLMKVKVILSTYLTNELLTYLQKRNQLTEINIKNIMGEKIYLCCIYNTEMISCTYVNLVTNCILLKTISLL